MTKGMTCFDVSTLDLLMIMVSMSDDSHGLSVQYSMLWACQYYVSDFKLYRHWAYLICVYIIGFVANVDATSRIYYFWTH